MEEGSSKKISRTLLIAVAAVVIFVSAAALLWFSGYRPALTVGYEMIRICAVNVVDRGVLKIYVRNLGTVVADVVLVSILNSDGVVVESTAVEPETSIEPQKVKEITVRLNHSDNYSPGHTYMVKVITSSGVEANHHFIWPELSR